MGTSPEKKSSDHIAVIGGGWAGCTAAVSLAQAGRRVSLFEASRILGGRARRVEIDGRTLDNGQHILLGAYRATLQLMKTVGIDAGKTLLRLPLQMRYPAHTDGMDFVAPHLPAPLHVLLALIKAKGLTRDDKMALARFSTTARWMGWQLHEDCSVAELLERYEQTERLTRLMWAPLCIAALNTPPQRASAQVFLNVLRDSLGARRAASDMLIPRTDLTSLFPQQAARFIGRHGGDVHCGHTVDSITSLQGRWQIRFKQNDQPASFDGVIIATGPEAAADLLEGIGDTASLRALDYEPITTCYLQYPAQVRLDQPFYALPDNPQQAAWGQFVFDRGQLSVDSSSADAGLLAVVVSAAGDAIAQGHAALTEGITIQLAQQLRNPLLTTPLWSKVISEKRATFSCMPGLLRPDNSAMPPGLALAGDYVAGDYPATLEAAAQSGIKAAELFL
ncbi:squalene-associated FAD-dependent desaturase [Herbaspirillum sp. CF444]|uniref:hydroxysqualene dehydroxylase HpnE n=1 Tax=Herbaspirillum sp. CF444 TaxID=1144319 RepID=UPI0002723FE0|nr:hydroxysqualene dehydroxylase HpnE [Herbaspirillum sp. CF444]EJL92052.1 squalene-associated FAD-dependent desaturase [Herbaspirillum sp. CF444]